MVKPEGARRKPDDATPSSPLQIVAAALTTGLVAGVPLVIAPSAYNLYAIPKAALVLFAALGLLLATGSAGLLSGLPTWWRGVLAGGIALVAASCLTSELPMVSALGKFGRYEGALMLLGYLVIALCVRVLLGSGGTTPRALELAMPAAVLFVAAYAVLQRLGLEPFGLSSGVVGRPWSSLGNASSLGSFLALMLPTVLATAFGHRGSRRAALIGVASVGLLALWISGSRGAWLGLATGLALLLFLTPRAEVRRLAVALAVMAALTLPLAASGIATRLDPADPWASRTTAGRVTLWGHVLDLVGERPLLGWGPETLEYVIPRTLDADWAADYAGRTVVDSAHNVLLQTAYASGIPAALALLVGAVGLLVAGTRSARSQRAGSDRLGAGALAGCCAYGVALLFTPSIPHVSGPAAVLAGAALSLAWPFGVNGRADGGARSGKAARASRAEQVAKRGWLAMLVTPGDPWARRLGLATQLLVALSLAWAFGLHARTWAADVTLRDAVRANVGGQLAEAAHLGARAQSLAPHEVAYGRYTAAIGLEVARRSDSGMALEAARAAARQSVTANRIDAGAWRLLATTLEAESPDVESRSGEAAEALVRAELLDPYDIVGTGTQ